MRSVFLNGTSLITGVKMPFEQYAYLIAKPGIVKFLVRFGLDGNNALQIMIQGVDFENTTITPIYALNGYSSEDYATDITFTGDQYIPNIVAPTVAKKWTSEWFSQSGTIYSDWFKIYGVALKGYTCDMGDLYYAMLKQTSEADLHIVFTNRFSSSTVTDSTVSIGFLSVDENAKGYMLDCSIPCPKTCGV